MGESALTRAKIYTSIVPHLSRVVGGTQIGDSYRRSCVDSFRKTGFSVCSINAAEESEVLVRQKLGIELTASKGGERRPKIQNFLEAAKEDGVETAIIINSDCLIIDAQRFRDIIGQISAHEMCILERANFSKKNLRPTRISCMGFDCFIFGAKVIEGFTDEAKWQIGDPWWDYWFPLTAIARGASLRGLSYPILGHVDHVVRFDIETWYRNGFEFARGLYSEIDGEFDEGLTGKLRSVLMSADALQDTTFGRRTRIRIGELASYCFPMLVRHAASFDNWESDSAEMMIQKLARATYVQGAEFELGHDMASRVASMVGRLIGKAA
jgi:hypothetical protein